jgi:hypothetical protein
MALSIQELMAELYNIQTAAIEAKHANPAQFKKIRDDLFGYWEAIVAVLRQCNAFALHVQRLQDHAPRSTHDELQLLLQELIQRCESCRGLAESLIKIHDTALRSYIEYLPELQTLLRVGGPTKGTKQGNKYSSGKSAMEAFARARKALRREVEDMFKFLNTETVKCEGYIAAGVNQVKGGGENAAQFAEMWKVYRHCILRAISIIEKLSDAVTIPAEKKSRCIIV